MRTVGTITGLVQKWHRLSSRRTLKLREGEDLLWVIERERLGPV